MPQTCSLKDSFCARIFEFRPSDGISGFHDGYGNRVLGGACGWLYEPSFLDSAKFGSNFFVATDRGNSFRSNSVEKVDQSKQSCQRFSEPQDLTVNLNSEVSDFAIQSVLLYNRRLTDSEAASVESWLLPKFSCPAGHQFSSEMFSCDSCPRGTYKSDSSTWSPSMLPLLKLWLDSSDASTIDESGGLVSQWRDKSGNSFHANQLDASKQPLRSGSSIQFDDNKFLSGNMPGQTFPFGLQVTVVLKHAAAKAAAPTAFPFTRCVGINPAPFDYFNENIKIGDGNSIKFSADGKFIDVGSLKTISVVSVLINSTFLRQYVNGVEYRLLTSNTLSNVGSGIVDAATKYFLATRADLGTQFRGVIYEVVVTPLLSPENRRSLEIYLATKWNVLNFDFSATSACTACPDGTFSPSAGAVSAAACVVSSCPIGQQYSHAKSACLSYPPITQGLVGYYTADTYNPTSQRWPDHATSNAAVHWARGASYDSSVSQVTQLQLEPSSRFIVGTSSSVLLFPDAILPQEYTLFYIASYSGPSRRRIFSTLDNTKLSGFFNGKSGVAYHRDTWITLENVDVHGSFFFMASDRCNSFRSGSTNRFADGGPMNSDKCDFAGTSSRLCINCGGESSDFAISLVLVYEYRLSDAQVELVEAWISNKSSAFCPIGQQFSLMDLVCVDCPQGSFKSSSGSGDCSSCPSGTTTSSVGSTSSSACISIQCPAGQEPTVLMFCARSPSFTCPSGSFIRVIKASYGRSTYGMVFQSCPMPNRLVLRTVSDIDITTNLASCNGQSACSLSLSLPDSGSSGYYVHYSCDFSAANSTVMCRNCVQDYYKALAGSFSCSPCPPGYSSFPATGAISCTFVSPTPPVASGLIGYYTAQSWGLNKPSNDVEQWTDLSPMRNHLTPSTGVIVGNAQVVNPVGAPAYLAGGSGTRLQWPTSTAAFNGTQLLVARYNGAGRNTIISCAHNDICGFHEGKAGAFYRCGRWGSPDSNSVAKNQFGNDFFLQVILQESARINGRFW